MGYYNPIYVYGVAEIPRRREGGRRRRPDRRRSAAGGGRRALPAGAAKPGLNFIRLATPTTDDKRLPAVLANTSGFVYYVSITGVTGAAAPKPEIVGAAVARIKRHTHLPVAVGFGVRDAASARGDRRARRRRRGRLGAGRGGAQGSLVDGTRGPDTVAAVARLVGELAAGVRGVAKRRADERP